MQMIKKRGGAKFEITKIEINLVIQKKFELCTIINFGTILFSKFVILQIRNLFNLSDKLVKKKRFNLKILLWNIDGIRNNKAVQVEK
jgi:hypothetical protein